MRAVDLDIDGGIAFDAGAPIDHAIPAAEDRRTPDARVQRLRQRVGEFAGAGSTVFVSGMCVVARWSDRRKHARELDDDRVGAHLAERRAERDYLLDVFGHARGGGPRQRSTEAVADKPDAPPVGLVRADDAMFEALKQRVRTLDVAFESRVNDGVPDAREPTSELVQAAIRPQKPGHGDHRLAVAAPHTLTPVDLRCSQREPVEAPEQFVRERYRRASYGDFTVCVR